MPWVWGWSVYTGSMDKSLPVADRPSFSLFRIKWYKGFAHHSLIEIAALISLCVGTRTTTQCSLVLTQDIITNVTLRIIKSRHGSWGLTERQKPPHIAALKAGYEMIKKVTAWGEGEGEGRSRKIKELRNITCNWQWKNWTLNRCSSFDRSLAPQMPPLACVGSRHVTPQLTLTRPGRGRPGVCVTRVNSQARQPSLQTLQQRKMEAISETLSIAIRRRQRGVMGSRQGWEQFQTTHSLEFTEYLCIPPRRRWAEKERQATGCYSDAEKQ